MTDNTQPLPQPVVPEEVRSGVYANELFVSGSKDELMLDFVRVLPSERAEGVPSEVVARVIVPVSTFTRIQRLFRQMRVELQIAEADPDADKEEDLPDIAEAEGQ